MEMDEAGRELPLSHLLTVARAALFGRVHRVVKARTAKLRTQTRLVDRYHQRVSASRH